METGKRQEPGVGAGTQPGLQKVLNLSSVINLLLLWVLCHHQPPPHKPGLASAGTIMMENCPHRSQGAPGLAQHPAAIQVQGASKTLASVFLEQHTRDCSVADISAIARTLALV